MSIPGGAPSLFLTAAAGAGAGFSIDRSLRFNSADSASLNFTPSSAGNRKTWTWSSWVKLNFEGYQNLFANLVNNNNGLYVYWNNGLLNISDYGTSNGASLYAERVFRDYSSWYHIVIAMDSTQGTASDRVKLYINGAQETLVGTQPSQNVDGYWNAAQAQWIGQQSNNVTDYNLDGYLAEVNFIDGSALDPTSFGELDDNNVWQPKDTSSLTFGTNGFRLKFDDNSSNAALGTDSSGNGNSWSVNNLSANAPYGVTRGGYAGSTTSSPPPSAAGWPTGLPYTAIDTSVLPSGGFTTGTSNFIPASGISSFYMKMFGSNNANGPWTHIAHWTQSETIGSNNWSSYSYLAFLAYNVSPTPAIGDHVFTVSSSLASGTNVLVQGYDTDADNFVDSPTNGDPANDTGAGGEVSGNYCTWNPLVITTNNSLANGNLEASHAASTSWTGGLYTGYAMNVGNMGVTSGKYYWEGVFTSGSVGCVGVVNKPQGQLYYVGYADTNAKSAGFSSTYVYNNGFGSAVGSLPTISQGDIIGVAIDMDNGKLYISLNGTYVNSGDPAAGTGNVASGLNGETIFPAVSQISAAGGYSFTANFGQRSFAHTAPSGYKALCTANLPDPTIADGSTAFDAKLWTGNGSTQNITGYNFSPDLVWTKQRNSAGFHALFDPIRGVHNALRTTSTGGTYTDNGLLTAFNSDGFSIGSAGDINSNNNTYVGWAWDAGSSTVSNTDGSITSQVRANQTAGFSIVSYTGNLTGAGNSSIGHGLNAAPGMVITKDIGSSSVWIIQHESLGSNEYLKFDTDAVSNSSSVGGGSLPKPTSNVFYGSYLTGLNVNGNSYIAYCFAPVAGYSAFGSYTGNGSSSAGPFVALSFRPAFILIKCSSAADYWTIRDSARNIHNPANSRLIPSLTSGEATENAIDLLSNGFKIRATGGRVNDNGQTFIYYAAAEHPFKTARAR